MENLQNLKMYDDIKVTSKNGQGSSLVSIINSKCGNRISIAKSVIEILDNPTTISIGVVDNQIIIATGNKFPIKEQGNKYIVYCSELVKLLTNDLALDFNGITTVSFYNGEEVEIHGNKAVAISA